MSSLTQLVPIPANLNPGLHPVSPAMMISTLGRPAVKMNNTDCVPVTHPLLKSLIATHDFGPFKATGLRPALDSLAVVMEEIRQTLPEVHAALRTAGMLCVRYVRGSRTVISNHAWGTAIDLKFHDGADIVNDDLAMFGLTQIAPIFNRHGWYWGAAFTNEDAMHFEVSKEMILRWQAEGRFNKLPVLSQGDVGPFVWQLQTLLKKHGALLIVDGIFGPLTKSEVGAFQAAHGLTVDGIVGPQTWQALQA